MNSIEKPIRLRFLVRPFEQRNMSLKSAVLQTVLMAPMRAPRVRLRDVVRKMPSTRN